MTIEEIQKHRRKAEAAVDMALRELMRVTGLSAQQLRIVWAEQHIEGSAIPVGANRSQFYGAFIHISI